jgi:uncharacterized membrane protein YgdD (TMEM256/DUF423 family)|tara:strand:+ start:337 stop:705 length:369 start_codon:yes stop_codon:yes gene_type:complete
MDKLLWIRLTALSGAIAVMLGAFAAHSMKETLTPQMLDIYQTGVLYHFIHTVALLGALGLPLSERSLHWAARCFMLGIVLFSGSLYLIAVSGFSVLGIVTPIGGSAFIVGWLLLFTATSAED